MKKIKQNELGSKINELFGYLHHHISALNTSKLFAGLMIIVLNIASRFVNIKLSKTMESYLKYTFSRQILIFAIAWMGTRDIYIALVISIVFMICVDYLFNENSRFCILPSNFTDYHITLFETDPSNNIVSTPGQSTNILLNQTSSNQTSSITTNLTKNDKDANKDKPITEEQIEHAKQILEKAKQQQVDKYKYDSFYKTKGT